MPKHLLLFGGGEAPDCGALDRMLLSTITREQKILYIPVADEDGDFLEGFKYFKHNFQSLGHMQFDMWIGLFGKTYTDLEPYGAVYLAGGNTYLLNNILKKSGFHHALERFCRERGPLYGDSAGAIVLGRDIRTAALGAFADEDNIGSQDFKGLNLADNFTLHCHYHPRDDGELYRMAALNRGPILALSEKAGLEIWGLHYQVMGPDPIYLFQGRKKTALAAGSRFSPTVLSNTPENF